MPVPGSNFSSREKLLGGGLALAAVLYLAQGSLTRIMHHVDDDGRHPVQEVHEHTRQLVEVGKSIEKLTAIIEKQHDEDVRLQEKARTEEEKRQAQQQAFWINQRAEQTKDLVQEIFRQQQAAAAANLPVRRRGD